MMPVCPSRCFLSAPCVIQGDATWSRTDFKDLKHLSAWITKNESSRSRLTSDSAQIGLLSRANTAT